MAGVPFECRMENGEVKSQLKRVFKSLLPKEIINRKKVGFPVPLADIPLGGNQEDSPMDQWLMFNCNELNNVINKLVIKK
jgi:asparagine synthase (glutamine-hydrolysing)